MKPLRILSIALAIAVVASVAASRPAAASVSFGFFYSNLAPHGSWVVSGSYGRVWQPAVYHAGWNPYYDGHWEYTSAGWCWDSDYAWGDIPYHYGTWVTDPYYGWVWVPGYTWAPSWVEFRTGPDYIGWAPVAPSFSVGFSFNAGFPLPSSFVFVHSHDFLFGHVGSCVLPASQTNVFINKTKIINNNIHVENNVVVNHGPDVKYVERATHHRIDAIPVERAQSVRRLDARGISRDDIRVNGRDRGGRGLRAAEPVSANQPLPSGSDRSGRNDRNGRFAAGAQAGRQDRFDRRELPDRRSMPDSTPRMRDDLRRGRDRQGVGTAQDSLEPRRMDRDPQRDSLSQRSFADRGNRVRASEGGGGRFPDSAMPSLRDQNRDRGQGRPDEGRMFRGLRERQPEPRADRLAPQQDRMGGRSQPRSIERQQPRQQPRSTDRSRDADKGRRSADHPKEHKDHGHN